MHNLKIIKEFPQDFIFGVATSSYQIEGSQYGQCGLSHWDVFAQKQIVGKKYQTSKRLAFLLIGFLFHGQEFFLKGREK